MTVCFQLCPKLAVPHLVQDWQSSADSQSPVLSRPKLLGLVANLQNLFRDALLCFASRRP